MTKLKIRRVDFDLTEPFERHWCGGDPFRTAFFNALSMIFPAGESIFIATLRRGYHALPPEKQALFEQEIKGFSGQEAVHRTVHGLFNGHLEDQGYVNLFEEPFAEAARELEQKDPRHGVALTAASEHMTALWSEWILTYPEHLDGAEPRLLSMFQWHAAEELEHRETAFDIYLALGGDHRWRLHWLRIALRTYGLGITRQTIANLSHDKELWKWRTAKSATRLLFGKTGLIRTQFARWHEASRRDYHPSQIDGAPSERWLDENHHLFRAVTTPRPSRSAAAGARP